MTETEQMSPTGSMEPEAPPKEEKKQKSRRPPNTAFRQQRLKAWQPILTPKTVLPLFFAIGVIFAPIGGLLLYASAQVQELAIEYTHCNQSATSDLTPLQDGRIQRYFHNDKDPSKQGARWKQERVDVQYGLPQANYFYPSTKCTIEFTLPEDIGPPVYFYYRLTNFYQNHRRYVSSVDQDQMKGKFVTNATLNDTINTHNQCEPLGENGTHAYYPCGLIANSYFNDTFQSPILLNARQNDNETYFMTNKSIAWPSDASLYGNTSYTTYDVAPPPLWKARYPEGYNENFPLPDLHTDESFQVWMRTAGLPTFSKLAMKNENDTMAAGTYQIDILDHFNVTVFGGKKEILFTTRTVMGGRNPFLGIAYIVVAGVCVLLGTIFTAVHLIKPRKLGDHTYLTWNNEQPSSATTAGRRL